jgi:hypothetical protein
MSGICVRVISKTNPDLQPPVQIFGFILFVGMVVLVFGLCSRRHRVRGMLGRMSGKTRTARGVDGKQDKERVRLVGGDGGAAGGEQESPRLRKHANNADGAAKNNGDGGAALEMHGLLR